MRSASVFKHVRPNNVWRVASAVWRAGVWRRGERIKSEESVTYVTTNTAPSGSSVVTFC